MEWEGTGGPFGVIPGSAGLLAAHRGSDGGRGLGKVPSGERARPWRLKVGMRKDSVLPAVLPLVTFFLNNRALAFGEH